jgi:hypothetical protein
MTVSHAKIHYQNSQHDEISQSFCFTRRTYHTIPGLNFNATSIVTSTYIWNCFCWYLQIACDPCRLRMNMAAFKVSFKRMGYPIFVGLPKWPWDFKPVCLGWCVNKMMLLIQWSVSQVLFIMDGFNTLRLFYIVGCLIKWFDLSSFMSFT